MSRLESIVIYVVEATPRQSMFQAFLGQHQAQRENETVVAGRFDKNIVTESEPS